MAKCYNKETSPKYFITKLVTDYVYMNFLNIFEKHKLQFFLALGVPYNFKAFYYNIMNIGKGDPKGLYNRAPILKREITCIGKNACIYT